MGSWDVMQVNSRRAVSAEADVERLQRLLTDAEKRAESLAWQVCLHPTAACKLVSPIR